MTRSFNERVLAAVPASSLAFGVVPKELMLSKHLGEEKEECRFLLQSSVSGFLLAAETLWLSC